MPVQRSIAAPPASGASRAMPTFRGRRSAPPAGFAALLDGFGRAGLPGDSTSTGTGRSPSAASPYPAAGVRGSTARRQPTRSGLLRRDLAAAAGATPVDAADVGPWAALINRSAGRHGVDPTLVAAVARAESGLDPRAVSRAGAKGLMQLMDGTARGLGVKDSFDPAQNVEGGTRFLSDMLDRFGSPELALAAYNAGPNAVLKHGGVPPFKETQTYVRRVLDYQRQMKADGR
ncbi:MAG TPA: lytic transglycosylase domain-containing protein [Chloroflexota bacterium]